ncbi:MAG: hypothetical protein AB4041_18365 [Microcystaceae cyanobacterium]
MSNKQRFSYSRKQNNLGLSLDVPMPMLPIQLTHKDYFLEVMALLGTGADINVLPCQILPNL